METHRLKSVLPRRIILSRIPPSHDLPHRSSRWRRLGPSAPRLVLVGLKVFLAVATGSLGVLSEALHSGLDLIAAILTWLSVRVSDQPADSGHTYGHGKFENFSAFVETGLLLATSVYIIFEAFVRLLFKQVHLQPSALAMVILGMAMGIDLVRSRALVPRGAGISERSAGSRRASFFDRCLEHVCRHSGHGDGVARPALGRRLAAECRPDRRARRRGHRDLGGFAARETHARRAAGRGARRSAGARHERSRKDSKA